MSALEAIYREHYAFVRWLLRARGVAEAALDDRVHDVFLVVHRRLSERDPEVPLRQWIAGLARNVGFSHRRSVARQRRRLAKLAAPSEAPQPDEILERRRAWRALSRFLEGLRPEQREVFMMVDVAGMPVSELATTMGVPANTLHSRLKVARARFSRYFDRERRPRAEVLGRARAHAKPRAGQRERTWSLVAASLGRTPGLVAPVAAAGLSTSTIVGGTAALVAATVVVVLVGRSAEPSSSPRDEIVAAPRSSSPQGASVALDAAGPTSRPRVGDPESVTSLGPLATPSSPPRVAASRFTPTRRPSPGSSSRSRDSEPSSSSASSSAPPIDPDQGLARAVQAVEGARRALDAHDPRAALVRLEGLGTFGTLERERRRLELAAACLVPDRARARRAATALVGLGVTANPSQPCDPIVE